MLGMDVIDLTDDYRWAEQAVSTMLVRVLVMCAAEFDPRAWGLE